MTDYDYNNIKDDKIFEELFEQFNDVLKQNHKTIHKKITEKK